MQPTVDQPNATSLPEDLILSIVNAVSPGGAAPESVRTTHSHVHSNDLATVRLAGGRSLVVKRGRFEWSSERFDTSRRASVLLRRAGIVAPAPLPLPEGLDERPLEAYWWIDLPILDELWPALDEADCSSALRSLGALARRVHRVRLPGFGPLSGAASERRSLADLLAADLRDRLLPAAFAEWPEGVPAIETLRGAAPELAERTRGLPPRLIHHDLHLGNVLCEADGRSVRCVGLLDLEAAAAGLPESDLAMMQVLHGPLFERHIGGDWFDDVLRGYGEEPDAWLLRFFRAFHLLNLGFFSALVGHDWHAGEVAREAAREVEALGASGRPLFAAAV